MTCFNLWTEFWGSRDRERLLASPGATKIHREHWGRAGLGPVPGNWQVQGAPFLMAKKEFERKRPKNFAV